MNGRITANLHWYDHELYVGSGVTKLEQDCGHGIRESEDGNVD